eukprot:1108441-Prymnesium_polylepis.1
MRSQEAEVATPAEGERGQGVRGRGGNPNRRDRGGKVSEAAAPVAAEVHMLRALPAAPTVGVAAER